MYRRHFCTVTELHAVRLNRGWRGRKASDRIAIDCLDATAR